MENSRKNMKESLKLTTFGFTLVELLAVIVILAIILVIAVPKVMSTIEDTKKATLESTAMMIASSAEKAKVQNTLLSNNKGINCKDIVQINDIDYERCIIEFDDENNALVTIKGSGKFDNLYVCEGDKTSATAINENCEVSYGNASAYIEKLEAFTSDNGLIIDNTVDKNIRYVGSNPNNKVYYNCDDKDSNNVSYGDANYDYASSCEVWRIIGVFDVDNGGGKTEKRVKLVRNAFEDADGNTLRMSWDSSASDVNSGYGINQWGESTYEDGTYYEGSDLMRMLNGYYIGKEGAECTYCNGENQETCLNDCSDIVTPVSRISLSMVENALWRLGTIKWGDPISLEKLYESERLSISGKICKASSIYNEKYRCTDQVVRTTSWIGMVGLINASDFGYASNDATCTNDVINEDSNCKNNNWFNLMNFTDWTFSSVAESSRADLVLNMSSLYNNTGAKAYSTAGIRPSLYLKSSIKIKSGNGSSITPYILN